MYPLTDYYQDIRRGSPRPTRGGIYFTLVPFAYSTSLMERLYKRKGEIQLIDAKRFDPGEERPDPDDDTASNELWGVRKFKHRPAIVLSSCDPSYTHGMRDRWQGGEQVLVAPLYSVWDRIARRFDVPREFLLKAIHYDYPSCFFLPGSHKYGLVAGVARFDYLHPVHLSWLQPIGGGVCLSPAALGYLDEWLHYFLAGEVSEYFDDALTSFREYLDAEGNVDVGTDYYPKGLYDD